MMWYQIYIYVFYLLGRYMLIEILLRIGIESIEFIDICNEVFWQEIQNRRDFKVFSWILKVSLYLVIFSYK